MKGVYILLFELMKDAEIKIGSLNKIKFEKGNYVYVGSAQNNIEKRIARHKLKNKKMFWHIDYLLSKKFIEVITTFYKKSKKSEECKIAYNLSRTGISIPNFGCSDCNCKSHLFKIEKLDTIKLGVKEI